MTESESVDSNNEAPTNPSEQEQEEQSIPVNGDGETDSGSEENSTEQSRTEMLEEKVNNLKEERDELKEKYLRKMADMDNLKKRHEDEKEKLRKYAQKDLLSDLLEVIDNFDRALDSMNFESEEVADGIDMINRQLREVLEKHDAEPIEAKGESFDPNVHEAMMQEEDPDVKEERVKEVFQKGYTLHDRVLRPAQVKVVVPGEESLDEDESPNN